MTADVMEGRESWPAGPWDHEPDRDEWNDAATGYRCVVTRHPWYGNLLGYVRIPEDHPLHGVSYKAPVPVALVPDLQGVMHQTIGKRGILDVFINALKDADDERDVGILFDVHGSVTFSEHSRADAHYLPPGYWYGFDCGHGGDIAPAMVKTMERIHRKMMADMGESDMPPELRETYRDFPYVRAECESLARQLAAVAETFRLMDIEAQHATRELLAKFTNAPQVEEGD